MYKMNTFNSLYDESLIMLNQNQLQSSYDTLKSSKKLASTIDEQQKYLILLINILVKLNYKVEIYKTCEKMIFKTSLPWEIKNDCLKLLSQCTDPLTKNTKLKMKLNCTTPRNYHISSPSLLYQNDQLTCNLRAVNYIYTKEGDYISRDADHIVRTKNYMIQLDDHQLIQSMVELTECPHLKIYPCHILGMEDVRLFGPCYYFCTRLDVTENHVPKICLGTYDPLGNTTSMILLGDLNKTEKNWLPMYKDGQCHVIYQFYPLIVLNLNCESGEMTPLVNRLIDNQDLSTFRGSAVPVEYKNGWLCTVHQVYHHKKRIYLHRFVWLSQDYLTVKYSKAFHFEKIGVEFNLGIACHADGLLISYSVDDANATLILMNYDEVDNLLNL